MKGRPIKEVCEGISSGRILVPAKRPVKKRKKTKRPRYDMANTTATSVRIR